MHFFHTLCHKTQTKTQSGFTLIEMGVVIIISGLLAGAALSMLTANLNTVNYSNTENKMTEIVSALNRFYAANSRLPCPAQGDATLGQAAYGTEIYAGLCDKAVTSGNAAALSGTTVTGVDGSRIRQGTLPTRALSLPDTMMYDEFGNKFTYVVTEKFTTSFTTSTGGEGIITINDGTGSGTPITNAAFAIISHGLDRKGGWNRNGTNTACDTTIAPNSHLDAENCDSDWNILTDHPYNDRVAASWFDDVVKFEDKNTVINLTISSSSSSSTSSCHGAWFVDSGTFTLPAGTTANTTQFRVLAIGPGGGGGAPSSTYGGGGGGGGGSGKIVAATVTFSGNSTITIGAGGAGANGNVAIAPASSGAPATTVSAASTSISAAVGAGGAGAMTSSTGGVGGSGGSSGYGGNGTTGTSAGATANQAITISTDGKTVSDGTNTAPTFKCATFFMPFAVANTGNNAGGHGGNGITSQQAPRFGTKAGGLVSGGTTAVRGSLGGGAGASLAFGYGGAGGDGGAGGAAGSGGGGGYGGGGGGGGSNGGGGGGYGGGAGGCSSACVSGGSSNGGGSGGSILGGNGGIGYGGGGGGGGGGGTYAGGGGGGNGLVYIEWDQ